MRKLYVFLDEWYANRVFMEEELKLLAEKFDVTVISNDIAENAPSNVHFSQYVRKQNILILIKSIIGFIFNIEVWRELYRLLSSKNSKKEGLSEIFRFYMNAQLFYEFLKKKHYIQKNTDAIYYSYWYFWKCFAVTNHKKQYKNIKIISKTHGYELYKEQLQSGWQPFKQAMDKNLDKLIFISDYGKTYYIKTFNCNRFEKYYLCYMGTENQVGMQNYKKRKEMTIVSCSSLVEVKRVELIIDALAEITDISICWIHFGDGPLKTSLCNRVKLKLGGKENIVINYRGRVSNQEILKFYQENIVDAFITTTRSEGNPVSVMEAMSFGIPIITTSVCNMPIMVGKGGVLLNAMPKKDEIASAIEQIFYMSEPALWEMRKQARKLWQTNYVAENNNVKFVQKIFGDWIGSERMY